MSNPYDPLSSYPFTISPAPTDEQLRAVQERQSNAWTGLIPPPPGVAKPQFGPPAGLLGPAPMGPFGQFNLAMGPPVPFVSTQPNPGQLAAVLSGAQALENLARYGIPGFDPSKPTQPPIPAPDVGLLNPGPMTGPAGQSSLRMGLPPAGPNSVAPIPGELNQVSSGFPSFPALSNLAPTGEGLAKTATRGNNNCAVTVTWDPAAQQFNISFANLEAGINECGYGAMVQFAADAIKAEADIVGRPMSDSLALIAAYTYIERVAGRPI